jgi:prepilin-type N-terminal cleavage/methylation domain-containing protein
MKKSGFTLLEILMVIAIISILAALVIVAMNPVRQLAQSRDTQRKSDVKEISNALHQFFIKKNTYPAVMEDSNAVYGICARGALNIECESLIDISVLVPEYLSDIPRDPTSDKTIIDKNTKYKFAINKDTGIYVEAPYTEIGQGDDGTIIFVGRPPKGYNIPLVAKEPLGTSVNRVITSIPEKVAEWPAWIKYLFVFLVGCTIGYLVKSMSGRRG